MSPDRRTFRRIGPDQRREAMIGAMLEVIAEQGITAATIRAVAARAGVTPGLIRHYFDGKEALLNAAYKQHMSALTRATCGPGLGGSGPGGSGPGGSDAVRLARFVGSGLRAPVVSAEAVSLWAGFAMHVQYGGPMQKTHAATYAEFRDHLQGLIAGALAEAGRVVAPDVLRRHAIACNAVIDGLWVEGCMLPEAFGPDELAQIGLASVSAILDLELTPEMMTEGNAP